MPEVGKITQLSEFTGRPTRRLRVAKPSKEDLENRFNYHPVGDDIERGETHERVRSMLLVAANALTANVPAGRELSLALTKLEEASFWANAGIARAGK